MAAADSPFMNAHEFDSLIDAAREGSEWAWSRLYRELAPQILGYLRVRGAREPEDLLGDVFVDLARNLGGFSGDVSSFRSWVFVIAHHRLSNERRRAARKPQLPLLSEDVDRLPATESAEDAALLAIETDGVLSLLDDLTEDQRDVIALRVVGDQTLEATARIMGKKVGAVKQLQRRALIALSSAIEKGVVTL